MGIAIHRTRHRSALIPISTVALVPEGEETSSIACPILLGHIVLGYSLMKVNDRNRNDTSVPVLVPRYSMFGDVAIIELSKRITRALLEEDRGEWNRW